MYPIVLSVDRGAAGGMGGQAGQPLPRPTPLRKVVERDDYRCLFCEVKDDLAVTVPFTGKDPDTVKTADFLCAACHELQAVSGYLIRLPGVSQADFNHLLRAVLVALAQGPPELRAEAADTLRQLYALSKPVKETWGSARTEDFAELLLRVDMDVYQNRNNALAGLLFLPHPATVPPDVVAGWGRAMQKKGFTPQTFSLIFKMFHTERGD